MIRFLHRRAEYKVRLLRPDEWSASLIEAKNIVSLGTAGFIMQLTNSLVSIFCNNVLGATGGDVYISVMTIISSVRQMVETPIYAINEGTSPILSYNYGARRPDLRAKGDHSPRRPDSALYRRHVGIIILAPRALIGIFSSDAALVADAIPSLKLYFAAFYFYGSAVHRTDRLQIPE